MRRRPASGNASAATSEGYMDFDDIRIYPREEAISARAESRISFASWPFVWRLEGFPQYSLNIGSMASTTSGRTGEVAALSI